MHSLLFLVIWCAFGVSFVTATQSKSHKPDCVDKCWINTQYISDCNGDTGCLCADADFQNAVYQCLYSQCATAKFGVALHHALGYCVNEDRTFVQSSTVIPALLRQDKMRKRQAMGGPGPQQSVSVSGYMPTSTSRAQSVTVSNYMTQSVSRASPTPRGSPTARGSPTPRGSPTASRGSPTPQASPGPQGSPAARIKRSPFPYPKLHRKNSENTVVMREFVENLFRFNGA